MTAGFRCPAITEAHLYTGSGIEDSQNGGRHGDGTAPMQLYNASKRFLTIDMRSGAELRVMFSII